MKVIPTRTESARWDPATVRLDLARALGMAGVVAYNWWAVVPFVPGLMTSSDGFFSDLEVPGRRGADLMQRADLAAGILMDAALLVRGATGPTGPRREWKWLLGFAAAAAVGARFPYACAEGLDPDCRQLEWHLQLPLHHYVHVVAGMAEFFLLTTAVAVAVRRTSGQPTREARAFRLLSKGLIIGYPLLGAAYLSDRLGVLIEPIFFAIFSATIMVELFEPAG